jgi:hypothetical protein
LYVPLARIVIPAKAGILGAGVLGGAPLGEGVAALRYAQGPWFLWLAKESEGEASPPMIMLILLCDSLLFIKFYLTFVSISLHYF